MQYRIILKYGKFYPEARKSVFNKWGRIFKTHTGFFISELYTYNQFSTIEDASEMVKEYQKYLYTQKLKIMSFKKDSL